MKPVRKKNVDVISVDTILEYVNYGAQEKQAKEQRAKLRLELLARFERGAVCSDRGPFLLEVNPYDKTEIDWKAETKTLLKAVHGKRWKVFFDKIVNEAPETPVKRLDVTVNPKYKDSLVET